MNKRIVFVGSDSFIAKNVIFELSKNKYRIIKINRNKVNLENQNLKKKLTKFIKDGDKIFFAAGKVPVKDQNMLLQNIKILENFTLALDGIKIDHFFYLSSDAVYSDSMKKLHEKSKTVPNSFHGLMHLTRENYIKKYFKNSKITIFRPTLVFGKDDPHNGYGPNKFLRLAEKNKDIVLFGKGEERRDHIYIKDLSKLICKCINKNLVGEFNLCTGSTYSFLRIAKIIKSKYQKSNILFTNRVGKMPHNGYRAFNVRKLTSISKRFKFTTIEKWIKSL